MLLLLLGYRADNKNNNNKRKLKLEKVVIIPDSPEFFWLQIVKEKLPVQMRLFLSFF